MDTTFKVKEFADLAGVTVRALQYYDRLGLLKPSGYTHNSHRLYRMEDLLRLQQILTFKYLGYGLNDIRRLMDSATYNVSETLRSQRASIRDRIARLQKVAKSIDRTVEMLDSMKVENLDWKLVREIIAGIIASERWDWVHDYYTPKQKKKLEMRGSQVTPQQLVRWQKQWSEVVVGFQQLIDRKRDPACAEAQRLATKMDRLIKGFTKGDKGIERSLSQAYANLDRVPADERPFSVELQQYMNEACAIHRKEKQ